MVDSTTDHTLRTGVRGAFAPVPTPVDGHGRLDLTALGKHLRWLAGEGLDGALILGTNGEFPSFTLAERERIADAAASSGSGIELLLGVGSCAVGEAETLTDLAADLGYAAVLCPPPFYFRAAPPSGIARFFLRVLNRAQLPVLLYHIPQVTGIPIDDPLLDLIGRHPRLAGVKDSSGSIEELARFKSRFEKGTVLVGNDRLVTHCVQAGGSGSITAAASICPALVCATRRNPALQPELDSIRSLLEEYGLGPAVKALLRAQGFGDYGSRPPVVDLDSGAEADLLRRFRTLTE